MGIVSNVPTPKPYTKMGNVSALKDLLDKDTIMDGSIVKAAGAILMPQEVFQGLVFARKATFGMTPEKNAKNVLTDFIMCLSCLTEEVMDIVTAIHVSHVNGPMYTLLGPVSVIPKIITSLILTRGAVKAAHFQKRSLLMENACAQAKDFFSQTQMGNVINANHLPWRWITASVFVHLG